MNFEETDPILYICSECESEIEIRKVYSERKIKFCPCCKASIEQEAIDD